MCEASETKVIWNKNYLWQRTMHPPKSKVKGNRINKLRCSQPIPVHDLNSWLPKSSSPNAWTPCVSLQYIFGRNEATFSHVYFPDLQYKNNIFHKGLFNVFLRFWICLKFLLVKLSREWSLGPVRQLVDSLYFGRDLMVCVSLPTDLESHEGTGTHVEGFDILIGWPTFKYVSFVVSLIFSCASAKYSWE